MSELKKIPVILDADTGVDDTMALILAARHPKLDVLAVTATFGNTTLDHSLRNTLRSTLRITATPENTSLRI